ncbi:GDP-mannose 4,6-dehydratase [Candidatus Pelagibacter communis]|uniref:GDP-mannose 4,6-dehydratase n=1 Tax=Pelagibacter ubique TaxID=198252 RepID=UPI00094BFD23|nr:GDP-mannose 4,6-dehydratase [Candidatus Pelagibacter ubique]
MKKRVLITGITGMVGSHLTDLILRKTNWEIYGLCRWRSPLDNIEHLLHWANKKNSRIKFISADLNDYSSLIYALKKSKPNYVFHLAAQSFPKSSFEEANSTFNTNFIGTYNLLNAIKFLKLNPFIHVCSSSEVFGKVKKENLPINENCNYHPASPYAISKVGTDMVGKYFFEAFNLKVLTTRMFTHTGPRRGDVFAESSFAKQIAMIEAKKIKPVVKVGNLKSLRTFADVRDAVNAYYLLLTKNPKPGEVYNIGGNYSCTVGEMLKYLISLSTSKKIKIITDRARLRPIDADLQIPDTTKFYKATGWRPKITFKQTMQDLLNYWRKRVKSKNFLDR